MMEKDDLISRAELLNDFRSSCGPQTGDGLDSMGVRNLIMRQKAVDAIPFTWFYKQFYKHPKSLETRFYDLVLKDYLKDQEEKIE